MSDRKKYNSIVFLTTLSVYLGLVLVGGANPSVLAQAATTRDFNIKNEIVVEDDLDKKPDDEVRKLLEKLDSDYFTIDKYFGEIEDFLIDLKKLNSIEKFDLDDDFHAKLTRSMPCNGNVGIGSKDFNVNYNKWLTPALTDAVNELEDYTKFLEDCLPSQKFEDDEERNSAISLIYDSSELKIEISGQKKSFQDTVNLAENLNKVFAIKLRKVVDKPLIKKIYENTKAHAENNQVFIVTRLPRASIDSLLAGKDAR